MLSRVHAGGGDGTEWCEKEQKKQKKSSCASFVGLPTFLDEKLNVKSPKKERIKRGGKWRSANLHFLHDERVQEARS